MGEEVRLVAASFANEEGHVCEHAHVWLMLAIVDWDGFAVELLTCLAIEEVDSNGLVVAVCRLEGSVEVLLETTSVREDTRDSVHATGKRRVGGAVSSEYTNDSGLYEQRDQSELVGCSVVVWEQR